MFFAESRNPDKKLTLSKPTVTMQMYEIYNEVIKDLLQIPGGGGGYQEVSEDAPKGVHVRVGAPLSYRVMHVQSILTLHIYQPSLLYLK